MAGNGNPEQPGGAERRAHQRFAVDLRARIDLDGRDARGARILDFCAGGLYLDVEGQADAYLVMAARQVGRGDRLNVTFQAEGDAGAPQTFKVAVTVARLFGSGMGVAFALPEAEVVRALQRAAERASQRPVGEGAAPGASGLSPADARSAVAAVRAQLDRWLRESLEGLFKAARDGLFEEARDATSNEVQSECMDALKDVERVQSGVCDGAVEGVIRALDKLSLETDESVAANPLEDTISESLALVDTGSFDDWVTTKNIITRHEPKLRDDAYALARRLSVLVGREVDELSNPAGLQQIGTSFNESMQNLGLARRARECIYHALDERLVSQLGSLYEQLNGLLVERGVLPQVSRPMPATPKRPAAKPAGPAEAADAPQEAQDQGQPAEYEAYHQDSGAWAAPPPAAPGPGPAAPAPGYAGAPPAPVVPPGRGGAPAPPPLGHAEVPAGYPEVPAGAPSPQAWAPDAGASQPVAPAAPGYYQPTYHSPIQHAVPQVAMEQAYQAARSLMSLQRAVSAGTRLPAGATPAATPATSGVSSSLLTALNQLQRAPEYSAPRARAALHLKERLHESLDRAGITLTEEENEAVDVLTGLIEAVIGDPLIDHNVKPRIHRLSVPLLKVALQDQGFFAEEAHPARQVVNRLGMLGLPERLPEGEQGDSLSEAVDPLVERILEDTGADPRVFESVLPDLDQLVQRQGERYTRNVESIAESREQQQHMLAERRGGEPPPQRRVQPELVPWFQRTKRLQVGDVVTFKAGSETPDPRTLAWVSDDNETFVFADRNGHQSASVTQQELALEMMRGTAKLLDSPDVPAMDRGVYEMLHRIHHSLAAEGQRDPLTGLMPPAAFEARVDEAINRAQRRGAKHALLALNLDGFATINEKCGRKAGDSLLRKLSRLLQRQLAEQGCITRTHADEFLILLEDHAFQDAKRFGERQCHAIDMSRVAFEGEQYPITASIGMVPVTRAGTSAAVMIEHARAALAAAKRRGGNQLRVFDPDEDEAPEPIPPEEATGGAARRVQEAAAPDAQPTGETLGGLLDAGRLVLRRQAVTALEQDDADRPQFEVLVGIRGEDGRIAEVSRDMVAQAERDGRMADVDRWAIQSTLAWMAGNRRDIIKSGGFAINLSGTSLADDGLLEYVVEQLTESSVPPAKVIFEVTESVAIDRLSSAVSFIRTLREYGCRFSVDDFGAGQTTFSYLKTLPVDFVKIDGMFVKDMAANDADFAMVKSINEIAHLMGKQTIAERVDSEPVLERLRELEVNFVQGAAVSAPEELA